MAIANLRARLGRSVASLGVASLLVAGCSSLIGVPDVPQPADGGEDAGSAVLDSPGSPDSSAAGEGAVEGTDAPALQDSASPAVDSGGD